MKGETTKLTDTFRMFTQQPWTSMLTDKKIIHFTAYNDSRNGRGSLSIELTYGWHSEDESIRQHKVIIIDSEKKLDQFYEALDKITEMKK